MIRPEIAKTAISVLIDFVILFFEFTEFVDQIKKPLREARGL